MAKKSKKSKKSKAKKPAVKRKKRAARKSVTVSSAPVKRKKRTRKASPVAKKSKKSRKSYSPKKKDFISEFIDTTMQVLAGVGGYVASSFAATFVEDKLMKVFAAPVVGIASYFILPKHWGLPIAVGSGVATVQVGLGAYASEDLKTMITESTGIVLGDGGVYVTEGQARLLLGAFHKATSLKGDSNSTPLSGSTYVISGDNYVVSGANSAAPLS